MLSMSTIKLYDYLDSEGRNIIKKWTLELQKRERIKLNQKLDMLEQYGAELPPQLLAPVAPHIFKLKVQGAIKLRPMLCKGTIDVEKEFTLLVGAVEIQWKLEPPDAKEQAMQNRQELIDNPLRRCDHERIL